MKTRGNIIFQLIVLLLILLWISIATGYDDKTTHPDITKKALTASNIEAYLKQYLSPQFASGIASMINDITVRELVVQGSTAEDSPNCRAANHFHNPLLPWYSSRMTDFPKAIYTYCQYKYPEYIPYYSNITWATGLPFEGSATKVSTGNARGWDRAKVAHVLTIRSQNDYLCHGGSV